MYRARIHLNNATATAFGIKFEANPVAAFEGDFLECAEYLRNLGVGHSVVIYHDGGISSCMNKPDLWQWLENRESPIVGFEAEFSNPAKGKRFKIPAIQAGFVGEYHDGKPYKPDLSELESHLPYKFRKATKRDLTIWHEKGFGPNDGVFKLNLLNSRGKFMAQIRFNPIRAQA